MIQCAYFTLKAVCSWKPEKKIKGIKIPSGFVVHCSNPETETNRFDDYIDAFESFTFWLSDFVKTLVPSGSPEIEIGDPVFSGKSELCEGGSEGFTLKCEPNEITISWVITISHQPNRTLDEFEPTPVKSVFEEALPELQKLGEDQGFSVSFHKGVGTV